MLTLAALAVIVPKAYRARDPVAGFAVIAVVALMDAAVTAATLYLSQK